LEQKRKRKVGKEGKGGKGRPPLFSFFVKYTYLKKKGERKGGEEKG
jgi:hypothetical protein